MSERPLVSVIIPAYNAERFIVETIHSVVQQTFTDWEIIIVDDGSTDRTKDFAFTFLTDKRITYHYQNNGGVSSARNKGFSLSKGKYIAFLDADDVWDTHCLEKKVKKLESDTDAGMVVANSRVIDSESRAEHVYHVGVYRNVSDTILKFYPNFSTCPSNIFCRREVVEKIGGFDVRLSNTADKMFFLEVDRLFRITRIDEILLLYRVHPNNMHRNLGLIISDYHRYLEILLAKNLFKNESQKRHCFYQVNKLCVIEYFSKGYIVNGSLDLAKLFLFYPWHLSKDILGFERIRHLVFLLLYKLGFAHLFISINRLNHRIPILLFHRVSPEHNDLWPPMNPMDFEHILSLLSKHYTFISLKELTSRPDSISKKSCVIVFDDGYEDFYMYTKPILEKYKIPTTVFLTSNNLIQQESIWTSQIDNCVENTDRSNLTLTVNDKNYQWALRTHHDRINAAKGIKELLISFRYAEWMKFLLYIKNELGYKKEYDLKLMSKSQIDTLIDNVEFESHSYSHPFLPSIVREEILINELKNSKIDLENFLNRKVTYFAYPIGGYNDRVQKEAQKYYDAAFAVDNELVRLRNLNDSNYRYRIPRFNIHNGNPHEVIMKINGFHRLLGR